MQKVSILIFILIISALTSLNTEIFFSSAIDDNGFDSIAPNYDYRATGFNPQTQINKDNVNDLELKWVHAWPLPESIDGIEPRVGSIANPIIVDGIVYNRMEDLRISAIDAKTGKEIWSFQADPYLVNIEIAKRDLPVNLDFYPSLSSHAHSFSFAENKIFAPWPNCQVFGLDAKTGEIEFKLKTPTCKGLEGNEGLFKGLQSSGPVFDTINRVLIYGTGGREAVEGGRGAFRGYSLDSGELLWTFYLMPPQDVGDPEWTVRVADKGWIQGIRASDIPEDILRNDWGECPDNCGFGKGDMGIGWGQWAVDEDKGIAYLATGNPSPSWNATYRPGPNVFSNSVLAIETKTGNLLWWHQIVAHDLGDLDCSWNTVLADIDGTKTVFKLCKGAFLYAMNAETGELIWSTDYHPYVKRGAIGPEPNFDFALDPLNKDDMNKPWVSYPGNEPNWRKESGGAESDVAFAYGKVFSTTYHKWSLQKITAVEPSMRDAWGRISIYSDKELAANATVWAHDAKTGELIWKYDIDKIGIRGGVTASGEMIWFCDTDGVIRALDEENGKLLWERSQGHQCPVQPSFGADKDGNIKIFSLIGSGGVLGRTEPIPGALLAYGLSENTEINEEKNVEVIVETEVITEEIISPVSYLILGFSLILIITSLLIFKKSRS
uniref:PQQ-dependent dehydrogenase n=1 Tax=uncultured marine thaumarchaeote KM3_90_H07 TaxID=1456345 RepID=A0A075HY68_9ARCH|nr:PQQ-dependent dehydrogenase [uncultured marine thaumarchaeote KM3_90_H07]